MIAKVGDEEKDILSVMQMVDPDLEQKQYKTRLESLSDPKTYAAKRDRR